MRARSVVWFYASTEKAGRGLTHERTWIWAGVAVGAGRRSAGFGRSGSTKEKVGGWWHSRLLWVVGIAWEEEVVGLVVGWTRRRGREEVREALGDIRCGERGRERRRRILVMMVDWVLWAVREVTDEGEGE